MKKRLSVKKRRIGAHSAAVLLAMSMAVGCGAGSGLSLSADDLTESYGVRTVRAGEADTSQLSDGYKRAYADFSLNLLRASLGENSENVMVSPLSVLIALEMTRCGASGETLNQMDQVLYGELLGADGKRGTQALLALGTNTDVLAAANSIWFRTGDGYFTPNEEFLREEAEDYGAQIYGAPFDQSTAGDINRWVEQGTNGMVKDILDEIPDAAVMYLVNAVAFDGEWVHPYERYQVGEHTFFSADGSQSRVDMMYGTEYHYLFGDGVQGFGKPYKDGYTFIALLPDEGVPLEEYLSCLDGETFLQTIQDWNDTMVETGLPKFEGETSRELSGALADMGMPLAFDPEEADFDRMGYMEDGSNLFIGRVLHKTYIRLDELGTEAAAATVVEMDAGAAEPVDMKIVILNRPFLYAIVEDETGLPVFVGVVEQL